MTGLRIAPGLQLDADYVGGGTFALLAKKGAGKTYTARVMAEEMWKAKIPFVFLDPMGAAWGLRSSDDGESEGIPVAIFGGDHGDAPLERGGGAMMADLVVDEGLSMVLDLSGLGSRAAERQFGHDFLERLYRRNSELVHLLMDEADLFAPQQPQAGDRPLLGVTENIVRRGRNRGIGITLITQRPAVLNKDVLTQVDGLVAMRIVGLTDRKAIDEWVKGHGDDEAAGQVKATLSGLENGECWWWVPELEILQRVKVRRAHTFRQLADEEARAEDPGAQEPSPTSTWMRSSAPWPRPSSARRPRTPRRCARPSRSCGASSSNARPSRSRRSSTSRCRSCRTRTSSAWTRRIDALSASASKIIAAANDLAPRRPADPAPRASARAPVDGDFRPSPAQRRILDALAMLEVIGVTAAAKVQLALFAQASPKSSGYTNNLGALRSAGLIDYPAPGAVALTGAGRPYVDAGQAPSSAGELHDYVRQLVGPAKARIIDQLIEVYPDALAKPETRRARRRLPELERLHEQLGQPAVARAHRLPVARLRRRTAGAFPRGGVRTMTSHEIQQLRRCHIQLKQRAASRHRGYRQKLRRRARRATPERRKRSSP